MVQQSLYKYPMIMGCLGLVVLILDGTDSISFGGFKLRRSPPDSQTARSLPTATSWSTTTSESNREVHNQSSVASPFNESMAPKLQAKFGVDIRSRAADYDFFLPQRLMDETGSFGVRPIRTAAGNWAQECLAGHRIAFVGPSYVHGPFIQLAAALGFTTFHSLSFIKGANFSVRFVYDTALFSDNMHDSTGSIIMQEELHNASKAEIEAFRHDVVFVNRGIWDLYSYNSNPKAVADGFYAALGELLDKWIKKRGGKIVVYPMHSVISASPCLSATRIRNIRLAVFAVVHKFATENAGAVVVTSLQQIDKTKVNILLFDPYAFLKTQGPKIYDPDGHHLGAAMKEVIVRAWLRTALGCEVESVGHQKLTVEAMIASSFPASLTERFTIEEMDGMMKTVDDGPPNIDAPCGCLRHDFTAMHPACPIKENSLSRARRHLLVQYLLKYGIYGASTVQVHELINIVCGEQDVLLNHKLSRPIGKCTSSIGISGKLFHWTAKDRRFRHPAKICNCHDALTNVQNRSDPRCAAVEAIWAKNKETCIYMNPKAKFDRG